MARTWNQVLLFYKDAENRFATSYITIQDQANDVPTPLEELAVAFQSVSRAGLVAVQYQTTKLYTPVPSSAPYGTVYDRCHMLGQIEETGARSAYDIVSPKQSIFKPDNKTLDLDNPFVIALLDKMYETVGDATGRPLEKIKRGTRQWAGPPAS